MSMGGGSNNMFSQLGQPPSSSGGFTRPAAQPQQQPTYQPPPGPNTGYGSRPQFNVNPNIMSDAQRAWTANGATAVTDVNARNLAALPEDQRAGYKPLDGQGALNQTLRENIQAGMGNYGNMVNQANQYGTSTADIQRAIGANTDMYTYMNRPNYQQYSPANNQYNPTIYQSNYQNYNTGNPMAISQYGQGPDYYGMGLGQMMNTPFNPYTNSYQQQSPFSYQQPQSQPNYGPSQAIVGRSSQMRGTPNVMRRAEGGIASLMDDVE